MQELTVDLKNRELNIGDLVVLADADGLLNDDVMHNKGDILQYIGGSMVDYSIGFFIDCKSMKRTDIFAFRTLKINKK